MATYIIGLLIFIVWIIFPRGENRVVKSNYDKCSELIHNTFESEIGKVVNDKRGSDLLQGYAIISVLNEVSEGLKKNKSIIAKQSNITSLEVEGIIKRKYKEFYLELIEQEENEV